MSFASIRISVAHLVVVLLLLLNIIYFSTDTFSIAIQTFAIVLIMVHHLDYLQLFKNLKRSFRETKEQKHILETINEESSDGIVFLENSKYIYANKAIVKHFGFTSQKDFLDQHPSKFAPKYQPDGELSVDKANKMIEIALNNGRHTFDWKHLLPNETERWTEVSLTKITIGDRVILHDLWRDINVRKELESSLREKNEEYLELNNAMQKAQNELQLLNQDLEKRISNNIHQSEQQQALLFEQSKLTQLSELISMIAHQWRQPLSAISTAIANIKLHIALGTDFTPEALSAHLDRMESYTINLSHTISHFKNFFQPNDETSHFLISQMVKETVEVIQKSFDEEGIEIIYDLKDQEKINSYDKGISHVILNILKNSMDAFVKQGININDKKIFIHSFEASKRWFIIIEDTAGGIDSAIIEKIFDPYFSTKKERNGTGLGLYMAKPMIEQHCQGHISVVNSALGAKFTIELPSLATP